MVPKVTNLSFWCLNISYFFLFVICIVMICNVVIFCDILYCDIFTYDEGEALQDSNRHLSFTKWILVEDVIVRS